MKLQYYWMSLPAPLAGIITESLDWNTSCTASKVCKEWYRFFSADDLWNKMLILEWPSVSDKHWNHIKEFSDWKRIFYSQRKNRLKKSKLSAISIDKKLLFQRKMQIKHNILAANLLLSKTTDTHIIYDRFSPKHTQTHVDGMKIYESLLVTYGNDTLVTTDLNTMTTKSVPSGAIHSIAISSAHKLFAGTKKGIDVWDPIALKNMSQLKLSCHGKCSYLKLHSGKLFYTQAQKDGRYKIDAYDTQSNQVVCSVPAFEYSETLIESENIFYAETSPGTFQFIDIRTQEVVGQVKENPTGHFGFVGASNGTYFGLGTDSYDVKIADRRMLGNYVQTYSHSYAIGGLEWIDTSVIASVSWDFTGRIFDVNTGKEDKLQFMGKGFSVKKLFDGVLVTGHADNCMSLWDLKTKREICSLVCDKNINCWNNLEIEFNENYLVGLTQHCLAVYDLSKFGDM